MRYESFQDYTTENDANIHSVCVEINFNGHGDAESGRCLALYREDESAILLTELNGEDLEAVGQFIQLEVKCCPNFYTLEHF